MFQPLLVVALLMAPPSVGLSVSPHFSSHPTRVRSTITIEPDERNRGACLVWDSDIGEAGSHCWDIEGTSFPRHTEFNNTLEQPGSYEFVLQLERTNKVLQTSPQTVEVN